LQDSAASQLVLQDSTFGYVNPILRTARVYPKMGAIFSAKASELRLIDPNFEAQRLKNFQIKFFTLSYVRNR
jgi:hypothetical protein